MRRRAEADASAQSIVAEAASGGTILGSARDTSEGKLKPAASVPFEAPKRSTRPGSDAYQPEEKSFFSTSAEERAEQARRAAQRVRRRARGEEVAAAPAPKTAEENASKPAPAAKRPAPAKPPGSAPKVDGPSPAGGGSIMDRAMARPPKPPQPPSRKNADDLIARSTERSEKRASAPLPKPPTPKQKPPAPGATRTKQVASVPLMERVTAPAKPRPTRTVESTSPASPVAEKPGLFKRSKPSSAPPAPAIDLGRTPEIEAEANTSLYAKDAAVIPTSGIKTAKTKAFAAFEWMIASRYLRARKKEGFVSVIAGFSLVGIALGVATLIVVMAVMTGFRETLINQIIGGSPHINITSQVGPFENYDEVADQIRTVEGVQYVTPVVQGQVLGTGNDRHTGVLVRGMRKDDLERLIENAEPEVINGSLADFTEDNGLALGANLAAKLGLRIGDFITLISPDGDITPFSATPLPRVKDYKIIQTFKLGVQEIDYNVAFMPFGEAQLYFNKQEQADTLDVFVEDAQNVEKYSEPIFGASRSSIGLYNWKNQNGRLIGAINLERQVMFVILTMIILVAALNIISGLVMLVKDKARDVAIMRTMGMARGSVLRIFFICGSSIGVIGSLAGVVLGVLFVWNIHSIQGAVEWITGTQVWDPSVRAGIQQIPTKLQLSDVALTLFIALGLSFIATLFPAWKAAKLDPVEALRYE